jgi:hypothetical protein
MRKCAPDRKSMNIICNSVDCCTPRVHQDNTKPRLTSTKPTTKQITNDEMRPNHVLSVMSARKNHVGVPHNIDDNNDNKCQGKWVHKPENIKNNKHQGNSKNNKHQGNSKNKKCRGPHNSPRRPKHTLARQLPTYISSYKCLHGIHGKPWAPLSKLYRCVFHCGSPLNPMTITTTTTTQKRANLCQGVHWCTDLVARDTAICAFVLAFMHVCMCA